MHLAWAFCLVVSKESDLQYTLKSVLVFGSLALVEERLVKTNRHAVVTPLVPAKSVWRLFHGRTHFILEYINHVLTMCSFKG